MKFGVIGCGYIGFKRANSASEHDIAYVYDVNAEASAKLAAQTGANSVSSWQELLVKDIDAVFVATAHDCLATITLEAVKAGKHVIVEKPAGRNAKEIEEIVKLSAEKKKIVKVGYNHRFHPAIQKARQMFDQGAIGEIMYIRGRYGHGGRLGMENEWRCDPEISGGGEMIDQAPHLIDLSQWFLGPLHLDYAYTPTMYWNIATDDNCFLALRSSSGQMAWLHATWTEWRNMFNFEIVGRDGKFVIDGLGGSYGTEKLSFYKMLPEMGPPEITNWEYPFQDRSWDIELKDFETAVYTNGRASGDIADAYEVLKIVDAAYNT